MKLMKTNYDDQITDIISNAERNLKTIKAIKQKLDGPVEKILEQISTLEFKFTAERKKNQLEIDEQRQQIETLTKELEEHKIGDTTQQEFDRNEKRLLKELKVVNKENKQMKEMIQEFKEEVDY